MMEGLLEEEENGVQIRGEALAFGPRNNREEKKGNDADKCYTFGGRLSGKGLEIEGVS